MKFYDNLSRIGFLKKYSYKFLFIAFVGIHIPLIGIIIFILTSQRDLLQPVTIVLISLGLTLLATGITLYFLNLLLSPLVQSKVALVEYMDGGKLPELPVQYEDEAGILMKNLQQTLMNLDELMQSKDLLVTMISHDVRKPLSHMISYAELAGESDDAAKVKKFCDKVVESGNRQLKMLEDILKMLQHHGMVIPSREKSPVSVKALCEEVLTEHQRALESKSIQIKFEHDSPAFVKANLFSHVVENLIHNAVKFSPQGSTVWINSELLPAGGSLIEVRDEGIGIDANDYEAIFNRFTEKGKAGTAGEKSTGLGLFVCRKIVERHGGSIKANSAGPGAGSTFTIYLPGPDA